MHASNLFEAIPPQLPDELVEVLAEGQGHVRIVRHVSQGHASVDGFWYDQDEHEWVVLLSGRAVLSFEDSVSGEVRAVELKPGDWLHIPPHSRHRVESTDPDEASVWLAVHWG
jgi:cupin 2 domain-containing protein